MKYLPVDVLTTKSDFQFSGDSDCTNGGVTATHYDNLVVPCEEGYLTLEDVTERDYIILELEESGVRGAPGHFVPKGEESWTMFGGNYVTTSDSRFRKQYGWSPIAVHDRVEGTRSLKLEGTPCRPMVLDK
jgi:hypothetical protein